MSTALQDWLHGSLDALSKADIDTRKKVEPKLAGKTANDILETKGIIDNALTIGATIGTAIAKAAGSNVPVSGDQYDAIRWLTRGGHDDVLHPDKQFADDPSIDTRNDETTPSIDSETPDDPSIDTRNEPQTEFEYNIVSDELHAQQGLENETTIKGENHTKVNYVTTNYTEMLMGIVESQFTGIDEHGRTLEANQLSSFNKYVSNAIVSGITPDDPKHFKDKNAPLSPGYTPKGTRALFNNWRMISMNGDGYGNSQHFIDKPSERSKQLEMYKCDTETLIQKTREGKMGRETFQWSDFMFCTYNGMVSNEHLITLRKFSSPVSDNILYNTDKGAKSKNTFNRPPIGTMITWLGVSDNKLENILSFSFSQNSDSPRLDEEKDASEGNGGIMSKIGHMMDNKRASMALAGGPNPFGDAPGYSSMMSKIPGDGQQTRHSVDEFYAGKNQNAIWRNNRVIQPKKIETFGVSYSNSIKLNFEYDLMSYGGINGRQAFADLLANILITCYNECSWYGQAYRNTGTEPNQMINDLYKGISGSKSAMENFSTLGNNMMNQIKKLFAGGIGEAVNTLLNNLGNSILGNLMNKLGRNTFLGMNSNMADVPLGFWHVTVGNPRRPIASIGNLWMTGCNLNIDGPLNIDGMPTKIKVDVTLEPCADRDVAKLEMLFNNGLYRTYYHVPADQLVKMYSSKNKRVNETSVSGKSVNNETNQTEHESTIDAKDNSMRDALNTVIDSIKFKEVETSINDLGCSDTGDANMIENS